MNRSTQQLCTFRVDDLLFGLEVEHVQEVIRFQEVTRVPLAPERVEGLINLRGQIVTAIDVRKRLGLPRRAAEALPTNVVLTPTHGTVSLLVDEIGDVMELEEHSFEASPPTLDQDLQTLVRGIYKLETGLLLVVDPSQAIGPAGANSELDGSRQISTTMRDLS